MTTITIDIRFLNLPIGHYTDVLSSGDYYPSQYGELSGPKDAFRFKATALRDMVKVIKPKLVKIKTFQVL